MISLLRVLNKPEYFFNPKQLIRRSMMFFKNRPKGESQTNMFGEAFTYVSTDDIGRAILTFGLYDLCVSEALWRLTNSGDTVLDIGANIGYFSSLLSHKVGKTGQVHCFEPNPQILPTLRRNTELRKNVTVHSVALSENNGAQTLFGPKAYGENKGLASLTDLSGDAIATVELKKLDDMNLHPVLIKMDIEGHELQALRGGKRTLESVQHIIFEDHELEKNGVKDFLETQGFEIYYLRKTFSKLEIVDTKQNYTISRNEPPNYLATKWPKEKITAAFASPTWTFFKK